MRRINTLKMVRKIRDQEYERTKAMSREELIHYYESSGSAALRKLAATPKRRRTVTGRAK